MPARTRFQVHVLRTWCALKIANFVLSPAGAGSLSWGTKDDPPQSNSFLVALRPVVGIFHCGFWQDKFAEEGKQKSS
jgi:hypothetical protein